MAYSEDVKLKVIQKIKEGKQIKEISLETGISIPTLYNWRKKLNCSEKDKKILNRLKTKIYYEKIDNEFFNEIESNESLTEFIKIICLLSICEKKI